MASSKRITEHITAKLVRNFGELGDLMRIYTDAAVFEAALATELDRSRL